MSLKLKIIGLLTAWLLIILLLCHVFIYYLFIHITTNSEADLLLEKARSLLQKDLPHHPEIWNKPGTLGEFLIPREMIRYVGPGPEVLYEVFTDKSLLDNPPQFVTKETSFIKHTPEGISILVMVPVFDQSKQVAVLEIGRRLGEFGGYLNTLFTALLLTSIFAVLLSLIGGYFYTRVIFKPMDQLVDTMHMIEKSGSFRRIELPDNPERDELSRLGATFNRMMDRLEKTFEQQKQFLADASHELRTPLTIIDSYANLLRRWAGSNDKLREEALDAIQSESAQLKTLTQNLLSLIDNEEEQQIRRVSFDLIPILESTAASMQLTFERQIDLELPPNAEHPLLLMGDPDKIKQLLIILLDNALKYSKKPVRVKVHSEPDAVFLQVIDQGIGITEADMPRLFDRFFRTDKARNRKQGGAGLGLAIADHILRQHNASIEINSRIGSGTAIQIKLPRLSQ
jgi:two-component system sensor histidine kinase ArlS